MTKEQDVVFGLHQIVAEVFGGVNDGTVSMPPELNARLLKIYAHVRPHLLEYVETNAAEYLGENGVVNLEDYRE